MLYNAINGRTNTADFDMDYIRFGSGNKNMIMIPGIGDGFKTVKGTAVPFAFMYRSFAKEFTVYVFSRRNSLPQGFTTRDMAADMKKAMDALNIHSASVVGVSQGGMIATHLAADYPDKVEKLVLAVTASHANETVLSVVGGWKTLARQGKFKEIMVDSREKSYTEDYLKKYRLMYPFIPIMKPKSLDRFIAQADSCITHDARSQLTGITCPVLVLGGAEDKIVTGEASQQLSESIPGSELYIWPDYSHGVYEQAPDFNSKIFDFLIK